MEEVRTSTKSLEGLAILIVDDEPDMVTLLDDLLAREGATLMTASNAEAAMALFRERRPDVIVSDITMPDGDGYQLMRRIRVRAVDDGGRTPAIALTAHREDTDHSRALLSGFQVHMAKPIDPPTLIATIRRLANR